MLSPEEKTRDFAHIAAGYREWLRQARREADARLERRRSRRDGAPYAGPERRGRAPDEERVEG